MCAYAVTCISYFLRITQLNSVSSHSITVTISDSVSQCNLQFCMLLGSRM